MVLTGCVPTDQLLRVGDTLASFVEDGGSHPFPDIDHAIKEAILAAREILAEADEI